MKKKMKMTVHLKMTVVLPRSLDGKYVSPLPLQYTLNGYTPLYQPVKFCLHTTISKIFCLMTCLGLLLMSQTCTASSAIPTSRLILLFKSLNSSLALFCTCCYSVFQLPACSGASVAALHRLLMWYLLHGGRPSKNFWITSSPSWNSSLCVRHWVWMNKWCHLRARAESNSTYPANQENGVTINSGPCWIRWHSTQFWSLYWECCPSTWASRHRGKWECRTALGRSFTEEQKFQAVLWQLV